MVAFACAAAGGEGQRIGEEARDVVAAHGRGAVPARWPALACTSEHGQLSQPTQPTLGWAGERAPSEGSQHRTWDEAARYPQAPPRPALAAAAALAVSLPLLPHPQQARTPSDAPPPQAEQDDWDTEDEGSDQLEGMRSKWREQAREKDMEKEQQQRKRSRR